RARERRRTHGRGLRARGVCLRRAGPRGVRACGRVARAPARANTQRRRSVAGARAAGMGAADDVRGARRTHGARGPAPARGRTEPRLARGFRGTPGPTLAPVAPTIGIIGLGYVGLPLAV